MKTTKETTMATYNKTMNVFGDDLEIRWDGNVWVAPSCGSQHARAVDAMEVELRAYLSACGEDLESEEIEEEMRSLLAGFAGDYV